MNHVTVDEHFTGVTAEIVRTELLHFFINKLFFSRRYPDNQLLFTGSVLRLRSFLSGLDFGFWV